jgi:hypothetical protein
MNKPNWIMLIPIQIFIIGCTFLAVGFGILVIKPLATEYGYRQGIEKAMFEERLKFEVICRAEVYRINGRVTDEQIQGCKDKAGTYALQVLGSAGDTVLE